VALSLANLAALRQAQGKWEAAEELLRRALSIREDALGPDHPMVILPATPSNSGSQCFTHCEGIQDMPLVGSERSQCEHQRELRMTWNTQKEVGKDHGRHASSKKYY